LEVVHNYIARNSAYYARLTVERIRQAASRLAKFPKIGHFLPELPESSYRQVLAGSYRVIYREDILHHRVLIMAVVHASRNLPPLLEGR